MKMTTSTELPDYTQALTVSPDGASIFLDQVTPTGGSRRLVALRTADLSLEAELALPPVLERLGLSHQPRIAVEPRGLWFAAASSHKLAIVGFRDRAGEDLVTRHVHESWVHDITWAPGGGSYDHLCAFLEFEKAVHFEPSDDMEPWPVKAGSLVSGPGTVVAYGKKIMAAYDIQGRRQRYLFKQGLYPMAVLPDGRVAVLASKFGAKQPEIRVLGHDGEVASTIHVPTWASPPGQASPAGVLAMRRGNVGITLVRVSDGRCVVLPYDHAIHLLEWIGDTHLAVVRQVTPDASNPAALSSRLEIFDVTDVMETHPPYVGEPPKKKGAAKAAKA